MFVVLSLYKFAIGIAEGIIAAQTVNMQGGCENEWNFVLASSTINICCSVMSFCGLYVFLDKKDFNKFKMLRIFMLGHIACGIYAIVIYFMINNSCKEYWKSNAIEELYFVMIEFVNAWISFVILTVILIFGFCKIGLACYDTCQ